MLSEDLLDCPPSTWGKWPKVENSQVVEEDNNAWIFDVSTLRMMSYSHRPPHMFHGDINGYQKPKEVTKRLKIFREVLLDLHLPVGGWMVVFSPTIEAPWHPLRGRKLWRRVLITFAFGWGEQDCEEVPLEADALAVRVALDKGCSKEDPVVFHKLLICVRIVFLFVTRLMSWMLPVS